MGTSFPASKEINRLAVPTGSHSLPAQSPCRGLARIGFSLQIQGVNKIFRPQHSKSRYEINAVSGKTCHIHSQPLSWTCCIYHFRFLLDMALPGCVALGCKPTVSPSAFLFSAELEQESWEHQKRVKWELCWDMFRWLLSFQITLMGLPYDSQCLPYQSKSLHGSTLYTGFRTVGSFWPREGSMATSPWEWQHQWQCFLSLGQTFANISFIELSTTHVACTTYILLGLQIIE